MPFPLTQILLIKSQSQHKYRFSTNKDHFLANMPSFMKSTTSRIIGGQDAPEPIPWQVALHLIPRNSRINCGATILDASTLLSAAHCFDDFPNKEDWFIRVGSVKDRSGGQVS